jgi:hypothetical protein
LVDPEARVVDVFRSGPNTRLREDDELSGEEVLPGFRLRVGDILPPPEVNVPAEDEP